MKSLILLASPALEHGVLRVHRFPLFTYPTRAVILLWEFRLAAWKLVPSNLERPGFVETFAKKQVQTT